MLWVFQRLRALSSRLWLSPLLLRLLMPTAYKSRIQSLCLIQWRQHTCSRKIQERKRREDFEMVVNEGSNIRSEERIICSDYLVFLSAMDERAWAGDDYVVPLTFFFPVGAGCYLILRNLLLWILGNVIIGNFEFCNLVNMVQISTLSLAKSN